MAGIIWLASYPKSGNTWTRIFLTNYLGDGKEPALINELRGGLIASARTVFDEHVGVEASELTPDEVERLRPQVYLRVAKTAKDTPFLKIHDAFMLTSTGEPLVPEAATRGVIYLLRNPLDVAVSYAHHSAVNLTKTIENMANETHTLVAPRDRLFNQLPQRVLSWSNHVRSWVDDSGLDVHVMRYEDMKADPFAAFCGAVQFAELEVDEARLQAAIDFSSFEVLKEQEEEHGFREKFPRSASFFRKGESGSWRDMLTDEQAAQIVADHGEVMQRFGYLSKSGKILI